MRQGLRVTDPGLHLNSISCHSAISPFLPRELLDVPSKITSVLSLVTLGDKHRDMCQYFRKGEGEKEGGREGEKEGGKENES